MGDIKKLNIEYSTEDTDPNLDVVGDKSLSYKVGISPLTYKQYKIMIQVLSQVAEQIGIETEQIEIGVVPSQLERPEEGNLDPYVEFHSTKFCILSQNTQGIIEIKLPNELGEPIIGDSFSSSVVYTLRHVVSDYEIKGILNKEDDFIDNYIILLLKNAYATGMKAISHLYISDNKVVYAKGLKI